MNGQLEGERGEENKRTYRNKTIVGNLKIRRMLKLPTRPDSVNGDGDKIELLLQVKIPTWELVTNQSSWLSEVVELRTP